MKINNETKVGILAIVVLIILAVITWEAGDYDFTPEGYRIRIRFRNIDNVTLNSPVTLDGFEIGRVEKIKNLYEGDTNVEVTLWIDIDAKIREGAKVYVKNLGFMGEKYIGIISGEQTNEFLKPGDIIRGEDPGSFDKLLAEGEVIVANIKEISEQINERLKVNKAAIDEIIANIQTSTENITQISGNVKERLDSNKLLIDDIVVQLNSTSRNLEEMSYDLKLNPWKLLYKEPKPVLREDTAGKQW